LTATSDPTARLGRGGATSRLDAIERLLTASDTSGVIDVHPLPDLMGASPVEIAEALAALVVAAHADEWSLDDTTPVQLCPRCHATVDMAVEIAQTIDPGAGPNPLLAIFDEALEDEAASREVVRYA
jgi:hypothetical protein